MSDPPVVDVGDRTNRWHGTAAAAALALVVGAMTAAMFASQRAGHWWGDDWALYIRQAQGLLDGSTRVVTEQNSFAVEMSRGPAFSPPLYPWGFPIILAPFVAVVGADVDRLAIVLILCAAVFACCWFALARTRIGAPAALVGVVAVTITPLLLGWTELIQSEWPFLAVSGIALVVLDRQVRVGTLTDIAAPFAPLVGVGLAAAAAFTVRREGLAMIAAIVAAQLAALATRDAIDLWRDPNRTRLLVRLVTPHAAAVAVVVTLQAALPSTLVPQYSGTTLGNVWRFRRNLVDNLAEVAGLKRTWQDDPVVVGSSTLGWIAVISFLALGAAGIVLAIVVFRRRDLHLVGYIAAALAIGGSFRSPINRYVCTIAPLLVLLGLGAIAAAARLTPWRHTATIVVTLAASLLATGNVIQARTRIENAEAVADSIEWGPTHPDAIAMFDAVVQLTDADDVVAAPKARAMMLETDRLAVQVDDNRPIPETVTIALVVTEQSSDLASALSAPGSGYTTVWENRRFQLFEPAR
ncbi:MAG: hypothetical protein ABIP17_02790 [Ilumatobacteraceae bacterium]